MNLPDQSLGVCPVCDTPFIRNRRDKPGFRTVALEGIAPPDNAYYPEVRFALHAVWCPACGWVKSVESPELGMHWTNTEHESSQSS